MDTRLIYVRTAYSCACLYWAECMLIRWRLILILLELPYAMLLYTIVRQGRSVTLYFSFSRPSKSMLFAQYLAIQIAHHMMMGTAAIQGPSVPEVLCTNPLNKTTLASTPFKTGTNRSGP
jgi:hypothetical protein